MIGEDDVTPPGNARLRDRLHSRQRGQVLALFALGLTVFIGAAALTIDFGVWLSVRRDYQNAVDPAVLAGAAFLTRPLSDTTVCGSPKDLCARRATWQYLDQQLGLGLTSGQLNTYAALNTAPAGQLHTPNGGGPDFTIWVDTPPSAAGAASAESTVRNSSGVMFARVERQNPAFMARIFGVLENEVSAWATAGVFPSRWAVITLRRGRGGTEIDAGPANTTDIKLAGTNSRLNVIDGDVGGNWGMKLTAGSQLRIGSSTGDPAAVYLIDYQSCGNSCWNAGDITDLAGNDLSPVYPPSGAKRLPGFISDPNYAPPPGASWPTTCSTPCGTAAAQIPKGLSTTTSGPNRFDLVVRASDPGSVTGNTCSPDSPVAGPGWYEDITVAQDRCLIFRGNVQRTNIFDPTTQTYIPQTQQPGIVYITGTFNINNQALVVGDGVTIVFRGDASFSPNRGVMDLNRGLADPTVGEEKYGAWTTKGQSSWTWNGSQYDYRTGWNPAADGRGVAIYVLKPAQYGTSDADGTDVIQVNAFSGLAWLGVTYAPNDNVQIAGQPNHDGIGQLISWTFTFNGSTVVTQTFDGPDEGQPYLIEPCVLVGGACQ